MLFTISALALGRMPSKLDEGQLFRPGIVRGELGGGSRLEASWGEGHSNKGATSGGNAEQWQHRHPHAPPTGCTEPALV